MCGHLGKLVEIGDDVLRRGFAEDQAFEQAVGGEAVGAVKPGLGHFAGGIEPGRVGAAVEVHDHAAAGVMLRRHHRDRLPGDVDAEPEQLLVDVGEMRADEIRIAVRDVEMDVIEPEPLDLVVDGAGDDVARRELGALVELRHEALAAAFDSGRQLQLPALAAHRLGDQEVLDLRDCRGRSGGTA